MRRSGDSAPYRRRSRSRTGHRQPPARAPRPPGRPPAALLT
ncbi:hypothetical protein KCH_00880 [Kitasatospora cheerisanensis KCTC 2395]|uniref:Uncharacterized protein n=1 Tax=Kitasatospora cheerisanensis KCTC 2395 TaxID=1348663 RepID=A0A066ZCX5_9ACTN|nr:hypothetical protein KCH_00880 [Kitasatospora cheerisanensis KCTC 2395]